MDGHLFLVLVATNPNRQRRGFGEAVTREALYEAIQSTGIERVCLQTTAAGKPVYERISLRQNLLLQLFPGAARQGAKRAGWACRQHPGVTKF